MKQISIFATLLVSLEIFAIAFAIYQSFLIGGWWILGLFGYSCWLMYLGGVGKVFMTLLTGLILAIAYHFGGVILSLVVFVGLIVYGEVFMKPKDETIE